MVIEVVVIRIVIHHAKYSERPPESSGGLESGRADLNRRPLAPHASALPDCATPRSTRGIIAYARGLIKENESRSFNGITLRMKRDVGGPGRWTSQLARCSRH
jgi:hypothetical protein